MRFRLDSHDEKNNNMLVGNDKLVLALINFDARNELINECDFSGLENDEKFYLQVLFFWLGATPLLDELQKNSLFMKSYARIYNVYYCLVILDKQISLLTNQTSLAFKTLNNIRWKVLDYYNEYPDSLFDEELSLPLYFSVVMRKFEYNEIVNAFERSVLREAKEKCLRELSRVLNRETLSIAYDSKESRYVSNYNLKLTNFFQRRNINVFANKFITASRDLHPFYQYSFSYLNKKYNVQKLMIPAQDGIILDGLYMQKKTMPSTTIVLALVGHFQSENFYITDGLASFKELFDTDIVFINHRNYAFRSNKFADNIYELVSDVVCFTDYFLNRKKNIVLYGMCGGAAHATLAAQQLMERNIPFKLIIDRFSSRYIHFVDPKTFNRKRKEIIYSFNSRIQSFLNSTPGLFVLIPIYALLLLGLWMLCMISKNNINFAKIIETIPEQDVLILQAKGKKHPVKQQTFVTDLVVHPENDMRFAVKNRRKINKSILKRLEGYCQVLANTGVEKIVFVKLASCFKQCLQLIDNEKLTSTNVAFDDFKFKDLHAHKLFSLETRHQLPIATFLQGFFSKPSASSAENLSALTAYSFTTIYAAMEELDLTTRIQLAENLSLLLAYIKLHEKYISHMADRLLATGLGNINECLLDLLNSKLFELIADKHLAVPLKNQA